MARTSGQKPRKGWIYMINPNIFILRCKAGHSNKYEHQEVTEIVCSHPCCNLTINPSHVIRGLHPYLLWSNDSFHDRYPNIKTFTVIPLTSSSTLTGLSTVYPLIPNQQNGLDKKSYLLINQITTVDSSCFKELQNNTWIRRVGQLDKRDKEDIQNRLNFYLGLETDREDWFINKIDKDLRMKAIWKLAKDERIEIAEKIIESDI